MATNNNTPRPRFRGIIKICLWFRENPSSMQESGPPIPNYFIRFKENNSNSKILGSGSTGEDGCMSVPFESSWPGERLSISYQMAGGRGSGSSSSRSIFASDTDQIVNLGDRSMDSLPENHYQQALDCSMCDVYYPENTFAPTGTGAGAGTASLGAPSPLTEHLCSSTNNNWGLNCCGYDWTSSRCGVQQFFPSFSFLHECGGCEEQEYEEPPPPDKDTYDPLDCHTCDMYYPSGEVDGDISPLTDHACTWPDQNYDERWGKHCCAYDWETEQCRVREFDYTGYLNEKTSNFLSPCGGRCVTEGKKTSSTGLLAIIGGCATAAMAVVAIAYICLRKRRNTKHSHSQGTNDNSNRPLPNPNIDPKPNAVSTNNMDEIASGLRYPQSSASSAHVVDNCNGNIAVAVATPVLNVNDGMVQIENGSEKNTNTSYISSPMRFETDEHVAHPLPSAPPMAFKEM